MTYDADTLSTAGTKSRAVRFDSILILQFNAVYSSWHYPTIFGYAI